MQKLHGMAREHHSNDPAPETQTCWSLWWGGREFNSRVSHYRILLLFRFEVRNIMSLVLVFTRYPAWQAWQVSVSSLITVVKQGWYSYFALCIARLKTRFYSLAFFGSFIFQSVVMYSYTTKKFSYLVILSRFQSKYLKNLKSRLLDKKNGMRKLSDA